MAFFRSFGIRRRLKRNGSKLSDVLSKRTRGWSKQSRDSDLASTVLAVAIASNQAEPREEFSYSNQDERPSSDTAPQPVVTQRSLGNRKPSKLDMVFRPTSMKLKPIETTEDMQRVERVIQSDPGRKSLVQALLASETDYAVKIRFCSAIDKLAVVEDEDERRSMTEALVELFLLPSSMFFVSSVNKTRARAIVNGQYDQLFNAKLEVLAELTSSPAVMEVVNRH